MTNATLQAFREIHEAMQSEPQTWQWVGPQSQRMVNISQTRAQEYAEFYHGTASPMPKQ